MADADPKGVFARSREAPPKDIFDRWRESLAHTLAERGFLSATDYVNSRPQSSLLDLACELNLIDVTAMQLERCMVEEAQKEGGGALVHCARTLLARDLRNELRDGWPSNSQDPTSAAVRRKNDVFTWFTMAMPLEYSETCESIRLAMNAAPIAPGWLPVDGDDPMLVAVFSIHWR